MTGGENLRRRRLSRARHQQNKHGSGTESVSLEERRRNRNLSVFFFSWQIQTRYLNRAMPAIRRSFSHFPQIPELPRLTVKTITREQDAVIRKRGRECRACQVDQVPLRNSRPCEGPQRRKPPPVGKKGRQETKGQKMISLSAGGSPALRGEPYLRRDEISERSLQRNSRALSARFPPGSPPNGGITGDTAASSISRTFTLPTCSPAAHNLARLPPSPCRHGNRLPKLSI